MERRKDTTGLEEALSHADFLRVLARALVGDEHRAQDLVQDAWVVALQRPPRERAAWSGFLARVVRNLSHNARRGERRRAEREELVARPESCDEAEAVERLELQRALLEHVLALGEPCRTALYERYYLGLAPREIAARHGMPVKTVKTRIARGLASLRARLEARSGGERGSWSLALLPLAFPDGGRVGALTLGALGGGFAMKKLALAAVCAALAAVAWLGWRGTSLRGPAAGRVHIPAELLEPAPAPTTAKVIAREALADEERGERSARDAAEAGPAKGALEVTLVWAESDLPAGEVAIDARCSADPAPREEPFLARTDSGGRARFPELFAGAVRLALDRGPEFDIEIAAGETTALRLEIPAGIEVEGQVVDADGEPVPGAGLWVQGRPRMWPDARQAGRAGADGRFVLRGLGEHASIGARAKGHQPSAEHAVRALPGTDRGARAVTLVLGPPGGSVEGRVLAPEGAPLAEAVVLVGPSGGHNVELAGGRQGQAAEPAPLRTDAEGRFAVPHDLPPGPLLVVATARGYPPLEAEVEVVAGVTARLELRLEQPASVAGRVLDAGGEPVAGVDVIAAEELRGGFYRHTLPPCETETDDEGRFRLDWLAPGERELNAHDWKRPELGRARALVPCVASELTTCELELELGATITGRVVDRDGRPLAGWCVRTEHPMQGFVPQRSATTDAEGRFLLANLADGLYRLRADAPASYSTVPRAELWGVQPGAREVELVVEELERAEGRVRGLLLDAQGHVPLDVVLTLWPDGVNAGEFLDVDSETGAFESEPVAAGGYRLRVLRGSRDVASTSLVVPGGGAADVGILRVEEGGALEVVYTGPAPGELAELRPTLERFATSSQRLELEGDRFVARNVAPGSWLLKLRHSPWSARDVELELRAGETTRVELEARPGREVRLECAVAGDDWKELHVELRDARGKLVRREGPIPSEFATDGRARVHGLTLAEGTYAVEAWTDAAQRGQATLVVSRATPAELVLELR